MSRFILAVAVLLMASCVSAQTANVTLYPNSVSCGSTNTTTDGAPLVTALFAVPTNRTCFSSPFTFAGTTTLFNFTASCNSTTGVVSAQLFTDSNCTAANGSPVVTSQPTAPSCNPQPAGNLSVLVGNCPIVATPTTTVPPINNGTNTTTSPPTTSAPTNQTTPKPGVAASTNGVSFSIMAAVAAVIAVACL